MDTGTLWLLAVSVATPVAAVVGFAVQLRLLRTSRLENQKLQLEIAALKRSAAESERRIVQPTPDEIARISHGLESRAPGPEAIRAASWWGSFKDAFAGVALVGATALVLSYAAYDLYRVIAWVVSKL